MLISMNAHTNGDPKHHNGTKSYSMRPPAGEQEEYVALILHTCTKRTAVIDDVLMFGTHCLMENNNSVCELN